MNTDIFWLDLDTWQSHLTSCSGINGINNPRSRSLISRCSFIWAYIKVIWKSNRMQSICIVHMRHMHIISSQPNLSTQATDRSSRKIPKDRKHVAEDHLLLLKKGAHFHVAVRPSLPSSHAFRLRHCETACEDYQHVRSKLHMIYISGKKHILDSDFDCSASSVFEVFPAWLCLTPKMFEATATLVQPEFSVFKGLFQFHKNINAWRVELTLCKMCLAFGILSRSFVSIFHM